MNKKNKKESYTVYWLVLGVVFVLFFYNQLMIFSLSNNINPSNSFLSNKLFSSKSFSGLDNVNINEIKSTAQTLSAVFPLDKINSEQDAIDMLIPTGTPEYGADLGVSFDEPVDSLGKLAKLYYPLKKEVQEKDPEAWNRFLNLATKPVGISCEFCCGVGPVGVDKKGNLRCGCQHNPAVLSVALYLTAYSDYSDAEILREVMKWKTLFFPKDMIGLSLKLAGGDTSVLKDVPSMVGGC